MPAARTAAQRRATRTKWIVLVNTIVTAGLFVAAGIIWHVRHRPVATVTVPTAPALPRMALPAMPARFSTTLTTAVDAPATRPFVAVARLPMSPPVPPVPATQPIAPPVRLDTRLPVPDAATIAHAEGLISEVFAAQLADPTEQGRQALSRDLLAQADDAASPAERYALLTDARRAAVAAYEPEQAIDVARRIGNAFAVDSAALRLRTLREFPPPAGDAQALALATATADACDIALATNHPEDARQALGVITPIRAQLTATPAGGRLATVERMLAQYDQIAPDLARLGVDPDDPAANTAVGAFHLFVRHDWPRGLPLAARGADPKLAAAARLELAGAASNDAVQSTAIGDAWWDVASAEASAPHAGAARSHAVRFYQDAWPSLRGLERRRVNQRLSEAGVPPVTVAVAPPSSPVVPPAVDGRSLPVRVVFLCDGSGSMAGVLDQLKGEVQRRIDALTYAAPTLQRFNVLFFNDRVVALTHSTAMRAATTSGKATADTFLDAQVAAGPSDMPQAVRAAMVYRPDLVVLLTAGVTEPGQLADVLAALKSANPIGHTRVDCVWIPTSADRLGADDLTLISRANGGSVTTLTPSSAAPAVRAGRPPHHVLYACQSSGSMLGVFQRLKQDVDSSVGALVSAGPDQQTFNVVFFQDDRVATLSGHGPLPATIENKRLAIQFVSRQIAVGSTRPTAVIRSIAVEHADAVYLFSDGMSQLAGDRSTVAPAFARAMAGNGRIDCMYLQTTESAAAQQTLTDIARLTGGRLQVMRRPGT